METGDVQKKDLIEHPENYVLLTTLDEGELLSCLFSFVKAVLGTCICAKCHTL